VAQLYAAFRLPFFHSFSLTIFLLENNDFTGYGLPMADLLLKDVPEDLQAQLEQEASAHFRTPDQEALARIEMSFQIQEAFNTKRVQGWIDEALASGPAEPLSREQFDAAFQRAMRRFESRQQPA
jgi:hypothetical protein